MKAALSFLAIILRASSKLPAKEDLGNKPKEIKEKIRQTCLENYGTENPFSSEEIKLKISRTFLQRYGVDHSSKSQEIHRKQL